jgi:hypothetical protein
VLDSNPKFCHVLWAAYQCWTAPSHGEPCDIGSLLISVGGFLVDIIPFIGPEITAGARLFFKAVRPFFVESKIARLAAKGAETAGAFSKMISEVIEKLVQSGVKNFNILADKIKAVIGNITTTVRSCLKQCLPKVDEMLSVMKTKFNDTTEVMLQKARDFLARAKKRNVSVLCSLEWMTEHLGEVIATVSGIYMTLEQLESLILGSPNDPGDTTDDTTVTTRSGTRVSTRAAAGTSGCNYKKFEGHIVNGSNDPTGDFKKTTTKPKYKDWDNDAGIDVDPATPANKTPNKKPRAKLSLSDINLFTPHHIVPWEFGNNSPDVAVCQRNTNFSPKLDNDPTIDDKYQTDNICVDARKMLEDSNIPPLYHPCNGVMLPDTGKRIPKRYKDIQQRNAVAERIAIALPEARDHATLHTKEYFNTVYFRLVAAWRFGGLQAKKPEERTPTMCVALQSLALNLLFVPNGREPNGFEDAPSFRDRVSQKIASNWK